LGNENKRGDQLVKVKIDIPTNLTSNQKELLKKYAEDRHESYNEEGTFDKVKRKLGL
jgi:DnaJ-class molecular chaperone